MCIWVAVFDSVAFGGGQKFCLRDMNDGKDRPYYPHSQPDTQDNSNTESSSVAFYDEDRDEV